MIDVRKLTVTYPSGKGVFELDFKVDRGEVMGYLGPNAAGKTTTIRALMGFMPADSGSCSIGGLDCFTKAPEIQRSLGYIPGEIAFLDDMKGDEFLRFMHDMRGTKDRTKEKRLMEMFELEPKGEIRKFSKGMKQKLGIITAFMHDPEVLVLDEPSSGLDPLMQNRFIDLIMEEKKRGKTILMSSHIFEEVERTCDNVLIIKDGRILRQSDVRTLKSSQRKGFVVQPQDVDAASGILQAEGFDVTVSPGGMLEVFVTGERMDQFIKTAARFTVLNFEGMSQSLEDVFMQFYGREEEGR